MRLGLRNPVHGADPGYQPVKLIHVGDFNLGDQVPCSIRGVYSRKAGVLRNVAIALLIFRPVSSIIMIPRIMSVEP